MREAIQTTLCVIVAFFMALRVVAQPAVLASPEPGIIALCMGGEIVYIALDGQTTPEGETEVFSDPCPFFGVTAITAVDPAPGAAKPESFAQSQTAIEPFQVRFERGDYGYGPRAPPPAV